MGYQVWIHAPVAEVVEDVGVQVDQAGEHEQAGGVHYRHRARRRDVVGDRRDPALGDRHVEHGVPRLGGVDDPAALDKQIVCHLTAPATILRTRNFWKKRYAATTGIDATSKPAMMTG